MRTKPIPEPYRHIYQNNQYNHGVPHAQAMPNKAASTTYATGETNSLSQADMLFIVLVLLLFFK